MLSRQRASRAASLRTGTRKLISDVGAPVTRVIFYPLGPRGPSGLLDAEATPRPTSTVLRLFFFVALMAVGIVSSLWSRFAGLLTYVWFALFRPQEWLWADITSLRLSLVVGVLFLVPSLLTGVFPNLTHPLSVGSLLFLATTLIAQFGAARPDIGWLWIDALSRLILVALMGVTLMNSRRRIAIFVAVFAMSLEFHTAKAGLTSLLGGGVAFAAGFGGAFSDNNGYALAASMMLPWMVCTWQVLTGSRLERWLGRGALIGAPLTILMIIGTMSRAGFLSVATAVLTYVLLQRRRMLTLVGVVLLTVIALPFAPIPRGYFNRLETIRTYDEIGEESAISRLHFWRVAMEMAAQNPLGVGLRNYEAVYDKYDFSGGEYGYQRSVHSSHFQVLAELGYLGALVWVLLFVGATFCGLRVRRFGMTATGLSPPEARFYTSTANALIVSMATFVVGGAFVAAAQNDITWYTFGIAAALDRLARARARELAASGEDAALEASGLQQASA